MKNFKKLALYIAVPLALGTIVGLITNKGYDDMITPFFAPPGIVFPIAWTILYILMGISRYIIYENGNFKECVKLYDIQLSLNLLWSFVFFTFKWYFIAFLWLIILVYFVIKMTMCFYKVNKTSAYLQIPYLLWLSFATVLSLAVTILN